MSMETDALAFALCAMSFYRGRNERIRPFGSRRSGTVHTVSNRPRNCQMARLYIVKARAAGWRGSLRARVEGETAIQRDVKAMKEAD